MRAIALACVVITSTGVYAEPSEHTSLVLSVAFSPDGKLLASASWDNSIRLLTIATGETRFMKHDHALSGLGFSPDGKLLASGGVDGVVRVWSVASASQVKELTGHNGVVSAVAFLPDGKRLVSAGWDKTVRLWDVRSGKEVRSFSGHTEIVRSMAVSPDGKRIASAGNDLVIRLWDTESGDELRTFQGHTKSVQAVAFSRDGKLVASGGLDALRIWNLAGDELGTVDDIAFVTAVAFGKDLVVTASNDRNVRVFKTANTKLLETLEGHADTVNAVAVSPDGKRIASGSSDKSTRLWKR